jgi:REP element-mobilizing transposase RayT
MPRKARIDAPGALHHIIVRGIEKKPIFRDKLDRDNILQRLDTILEESRTPCYAWALMPNHLHLLLKTGLKPISTVMRQLLTGHAVYFNRRHKRNGHLFQNRYKSILCQEDAYLLELVRYIHLNPLRGGIVHSSQELKRYPYGGHSSMMGKCKQPWHMTNYVLGFFGDKESSARKAYHQFVEKGISRGKRPELTGGGLVRSVGGWSALIGLRAAKLRIASDERILGDGDFIEAVLKAANEQLEKRYQLKSRGFDLPKVAEKVAELMNIPVEMVWEKSRRPQVVKARDLVCYWANLELGISITALAKQFRRSQSTISVAVRRGETLAKENQYTLMD